MTDISSGMDNPAKRNFSGKVKLFRSLKEGFKDGEQLRDFIYVEDVCKVMNWMAESMLNTRLNESFGQGQWSTAKNGIYNLGTGKARTFIELVTPIFSAMNLPVNIEFFDMPEDIRDKYQYFTEADMTKLKAAGYREDLSPVTIGVGDYVKNYLMPQKFY
ncbi:MAG: NAD-dependent epimerase/dehydratase family protein [Bacteroidetes bacterium]|nr:NAD-dependent epimerase/dehydratase family protein [Bacteroidota bacterium]MBS1632319.1 NAD-dependent epimerase/dehydratase family protein [Bacteroidota bacterium]